MVRPSLAPGAGMVQIRRRRRTMIYRCGAIPGATRRMAAGVALAWHRSRTSLFLRDRARFAASVTIDQRHRPDDRAACSPPSPLVAAGRRSTGRLRTELVPPRRRPPLSWGIGQAIWTWYEVVLDQEVPYPGLADVGYLGAVPFLLAGVLLFPSRSLRPWVAPER